MTAKPEPLRALPQSPEQPRVLTIRHQRRDEHELRCIMAWRQREHPAWSQFAVSFRVSGPKIRRVK